MNVARTPAEVREALAAGAPRGPPHRPRADDGLPARGPPLPARRRPRGVRRRRDEPLRQPGAVPARARTSTPTPATRSDDLRLAEEAGADLVYAPAAGDVYPDGFSTEVRVSGLTEVLEGDPASRGPEHFHGVTTVVAKLFNTVGPDIAYFGQKDAQQAVVIRRMAADLDFPVADPDPPDHPRARRAREELAQRAALGAEERERAVALSRALRAVSERAETEGLGEALERGRQELEAAGIRPEYLEARDAETLAPVAEQNGRPVLVAVAARLGDTRLIDNVLIEP